MDTISTHKIREMDEADRPREKLEKHGPAALSNAELIAILLNTGMVGMNVVDMARALLKAFPSLISLKRASVKELQQIKGIGEAKAITLAAAFALGDRMARETVSREKVDSPEIVERLLGAEMRGLTKETLRVILLDVKMMLMRIEEITIGTATMSLAHPREIFRPAIVHNAYGFVLVHNHPTGDVTPSQADRQLTRQIREASQFMDMRCFDHIILGQAGEGRPSYYSFKENGLL